MGLLESSEEPVETGFFLILFYLIDFTVPFVAAALECTPR